MKAWTSSPAAFLDGTALVEPDFNRFQAHLAVMDFMALPVAQQVMDAAVGKISQALQAWGFEVGAPAPVRRGDDPGTGVVWLLQDLAVGLPTTSEKMQHVRVTTVLVIRSDAALLGASYLAVRACRADTLSALLEDPHVVLRDELVWYDQSPPDIKTLVELTKALTARFGVRMQPEPYEVVAEKFAYSLDEDSSP